MILPSKDLSNGHFNNLIFRLALRPSISHHLIVHLNQLFAERCMQWTVPRSPHSQKVCPCEQTSDTWQIKWQIGWRMIWTGGPQRRQVLTSPSEQGKYKHSVLSAISSDNLLLKVRLVKDLLLSTSKPLKSVFYLKHHNQTTSYFYWNLTSQLQFLVLLHSLKDFLKCFNFNGTWLIDCPGSTITCSCYICCFSQLMIFFSF